jgi:hypothetical protein
MQVIAEQHLQGVFSGRQRNFGAGAAIPEVYVVLISRNRQSKVRQTGIDQQVVVPGMGLLITGFYDIHTCDTEFDTDRIGYGCAVCRHYEKDAGAIG